MSKVNMRCLKDQRWSFGDFVKDQTVEVDLDTAKTMYESKYAVPVDGIEALDYEEEKQLKSPSKENKELAPPAEENKTDSEEDESPSEEETPGEGDEPSPEEPSEEEQSDSEESAPSKVGKKSTKKKKK